MPDIIIVGGGITGAAAAYEVACAGRSVLVIEKRRLAAMASGWSLGGIRQSGRNPAELPLARAAVERWAALDDELAVPTGNRRPGNLRLARTPDEIGTIKDLVAEQRSRGLEIEYLSDNGAVRDVAPAIGPGVLAASFCRSDGQSSVKKADQAG